jgi:hypothetical protein
MNTASVIESQNLVVAQKKPREMSAKGFLQKLNRATSAVRFFEEHKDWMLHSEMALALIPILARLDIGDLMPTPALALVGEVVVKHLLSEGMKQAPKMTQEEEAPDDPFIAPEHRMPQVAPPDPESAKKAWLAVVYNSDGEVMSRQKPNGEWEEMCREFEASHVAQRWLDRRLAFDSASDYVGIVQHSRSKVQEIITRDEAMSRVYAAKKLASHRRVGAKSGGALSFRPKVKETRVSFSHG